MGQVAGVGGGSFDCGDGSCELLLVLANASDLGRGCSTVGGISGDVAAAIGSCRFFCMNCCCGVNCAAVLVASVLCLKQCGMVGWRGEIVDVSIDA